MPGPLLPHCHCPAADARRSSTLGPTPESAGSAGGSSSQQPWTDQGVKSGDMIRTLTEMCSLLLGFILYTETISMCGKSLIFSCATNFIGFLKLLLKVSTYIILLALYKEVK